MNEEEDQFKQFLPEDKLDRDNLFVEIPARQTPIHPERVPSGFEPMGEIQLRGRAFRGLTNGQVAWWVLFTAWFIFGGFAWLMLHIVLRSSPLVFFMLFAIAIIPLVILLKGTLMKLANQRNERD